MNNQSLKKSSFVLILGLLLAGMTARNANKQYAITITAGAFDRLNTVVFFTLPNVIEAGTYRMEREQGKAGPPVTLQVDSNNTAWFILERLSAGSSRTYHLDLRSSSSFSTAEAGVTKSIDENTISMSTDGREIFSFYHGDNEPPEEMDELYTRGGYIHPVYSPNGVPLTNHLDEKMHPHHYGIWSAWTRTRFQGRTPDFWNIHSKTGRVNHADSLEAAWQGPVQGGFRARNYFVDLSASAPVIALNEEWEVMAYNTVNSDYNIFDLLLIQTANTAQPLHLPEYRYGGLAFRGHGNWDNPANVSFLTSEGYDRSNGNATRARWCHIGGTVDGKRAGIAVLGHPDNYRAPQPVRIHPEMPYFVYSPSQLGAMSIEPGSPYVMRYRYVTYDGEADPDELDRIWNDYAYPPGVTVVAE